MKKVIIAALLASAAGSAQGAGDRLTPDQLPEPSVETRPTNQSGPYLGAGFSVGQGRTTEPDASTGLGLLAHLGAGYQVSRGSWNRLELGADAFFGRVDYRLVSGSNVSGKATIPVNLGLLVKGAYGYGLGGPIYGLVTIGAGPVLGSFQLEDPAAGKVTSSSLVGLAWQVGWQFVAPIGDSVDLTGGLSWTQFAFDVGNLSGGGHTFSYNRNVITSVPALDFGLRLRI